MRERPRRVLGYIRVSGAEQGRTGTSLDAQREEIVRFAAAHDYPTPAVHVEVESAGAEKLDRRSVLRALLADVREGDMVVVSKQDRWSRDTLFYLSSTRDIVARGARFYSIAERFDPETPEGRFAATIMAAVAEQERERIRERTVLRRKALRDAGQYVEGLPPVGYVRGPGNILAVVEVDAAIVRDVFARCLAGRSVRQIVEHLQVEHPDRHGWDHKTALRMLRSRVYLGEVQTSTGAWVASHAPIVDRATFELAAAGLESRRLGGRRGSSVARTHWWLLRGLARCRACGARMYSAYSDGARSYYSCSARCGAFYVPVAAADEAVGAAVEARLHELRRELARPGAGAPRPAASGGVDAKRERLHQKRERTIDLAADGAITRAELAARLADIDRDVGRLDVAAEAERREAEARRPARRAELLATVRALAAAWKRLDVPERRQIVRDLAEDVAIQRDEEPRITWRPLADLLALAGPAA